MSEMAFQQLTNEWPPRYTSRTFPVTTALPRMALPWGLLWIVNEREGDIAAVWTYTCLRFDEVRHIGPEGAMALDLDVSRIGDIAVIRCRGRIVFWCFLGLIGDRFESS